MGGERDRVEVHLDADELGSPRLVGQLARERSHGSSVVSFGYEPAWVAAERAFPIDPALPLYEGEQYPRTLPGILADAAPDRWGRTLMERRETLTARREERRPRRLEEWDFLVGVHDLTRMGALRLARPGGGGYVADEPLAVPPLARLRALEHWAWELEQGLSSEMGEEDKWLAMLIAPGSSLGGARPKASYTDGGALWIAKFPSREDRHDVGVWEHLLLRLAEEAGVEVPESRLLRLGQGYGTFCARRFDRIDGVRRLYASAMTLSGRRDGDEASYLDIARAIVDFGEPAAIEADLSQLFRRLVFNLLVGNRDDHLRNHGFLRHPHGWRLAPAFDVNPAPDKLEHNLSIDDSVRAPDLEVARETAPLYRLDPARADAIVAEVAEVVSGWPVRAREAGLPREEIDLIGTAFASA